MVQKSVVVILGPTGVGKSKVGIELAKRLSGEVISADAFAIYKKLDIGTAKITLEESDGVKHHLVDILEPEENYSAYLHVEGTKECIEDILSRGKVPIIVGGTGLYVKSLIEEYNFGGTERRDEYRAELEKVLEENGVEALAKMLVDMSKEIAGGVDLKNSRRVIRALEIAKFGSEKKTGKTNHLFKTFVLSADREIVYGRIDSRIDKMLYQGLIPEIESLLKSGLTENHQSMQAIGYKEFLPYVKGEMGIEECVELAKQHTRNYAKRQETYFKSMKDAVWIDATNLNKAIEVIYESIK